EAWRKEKTADQLTITLPPDAHCEKKWEAKKSELGADVDVEATMTAALTVRKTEGFLAQLSGIFSRKEPITVAPRGTIAFGKLKQYVSKNISRHVRKEPQDAKFIVLGEGHSIVPGKPGLAVDLDKSLVALQARAPISSIDPLVLPTVLKVPHVTEADLAGIE